MTVPMNEARAVEHLLALLAVPGISGRERAVADVLRGRLLEAGCAEKWICEDDVHTRIPGDFEMGNLIVKLPGTVPGERLMFSGHMDTVPLCRGAVPKREGDRIVPEADTALGADNRTACAAMLVLAETLLREKLPHPPLTLIFSVGEEIGLWGAKEVNPDDLGNPVMGFNIDSGDPARVIVGAIGAHRWEVKIRGISAHAGVHPEHGVSAALIAARAVAWIAERGYFGLIQKDGRAGTSNIGVIEGGEATNQVTDKVLIKGESRSHDPAFLEEITGTIRQCFEEAAASVVSSKGKSGAVEFICHKDYHAFRISEEEPAVARTVSALKALGLEAVPEVTNGGLDANFYNVKGIPTVTLGAGQHNPHTVDEYADVPEYLTACRLLLRIVADAAG
jgi:tripeptide aminopeptidase